MDKVRYDDEYLLDIIDSNHAFPSVYDMFNTSSSSSYNKKELGGITKEQARLFEDFMREYLQVPREYRDVIECKIVNPLYTHTEIAKELRISRKCLYMRYLKIISLYPHLIYFTHRLFEGNEKRAYNSGGPSKEEEKEVEEGDCGKEEECEECED